MLREWQSKLVRRGSSVDQRKRCLTVLTTALNRAALQGLMHFNPCLHVTKPKVERQEIQPLELDQQRAVIAAAAEFRLGEIVTVAIHTGLRRGELFGLQWSAVNLAEGILNVRHSLEEVSGTRRLKAPKSKMGRRMVPLTTQAVDALKGRQAAALAEGMSNDEVPVVFPDTCGGFMRGSNFDRRFWRPVKAKAGLPVSVRFHDLRHTFASTMLEAGARMDVLQKLMGHASYQTTADVYSHLLQGARSDAISMLAEYHERQGIASV